MRRKKKLPQGTFPTTIESLTQQGRGVVHIDDKATFIARALPGEQVDFVYTNRRRHYDEGDAVEIHQQSPDRVEPGCAHFSVCGGCAMQHLAHAAQIRTKQNALQEQLERIGKVTPETWLAPIEGPQWGYRRKARLGVRWVHKKGRALVGFRERNTHFIADISHCPVLDPRVGEKLASLSELIGSLQARRAIPQIEVACGDEHTALAFRHLEPLCAEDQAKLDRFGDEHGFALFLQSGGPQTLKPLTDRPRDRYPSYRLTGFDSQITFSPLDFTQVNATINQLMVEKSIELLDIQSEDTVLDLFAGLGNFTQPLARHAKEVVSVEVDEAMVARGEQSARSNGIENTHHQIGNLFEPDTNLAWMRRSYQRVLLDPPRAGAAEMMPHLAKMAPERIVYISCHPGSLARDIGILVHEHGYKLLKAGVMDMFPHTGHVESIAVLEPAR